MEFPDRAHRQLPPSASRVHLRGSVPSPTAAASTHIVQGNSPIHRAAAGAVNPVAHRRSQPTGTSSLAPSPAPPSPHTHNVTRMSREPDGSVQETETDIDCRRPIQQSRKHLRSNVRERPHRGIVRMAPRHLRPRSFPERPSNVFVRRRKPHVWVSLPRAPATNAQFAQSWGAPHPPLATAIPSHPTSFQRMPPPPAATDSGGPPPLITGQSDSARHPRPPWQATVSPRSSRSSSKRSTSRSNDQRRPPREPTHPSTRSTTAATIVGQLACRTIRPTITLGNDPASITHDSQQTVGQPD